MWCELYHLWTRTMFFSTPSFMRKKGGGSLSLLGQLGRGAAYLSMTTLYTEWQRCSVLTAERKALSCRYRKRIINRPTGRINRYKKSLCGAEANNLCVFTLDLTWFIPLFIVLTAIIDIKIQNVTMYPLQNLSWPSIVKKGCRLCYLPALPLTFGGAKYRSTLDIV